MFALFPDAPADKKEGIRAKVKEYMDRAEQIKQKVIEEKEGTVDTTINYVHLLHYNII